MAEDRISSIIDLQAIQKEVDATKSSVQQVIDLIKSVKGTAISISGAKTVGEFNTLKKQLDEQIVATNKAATATKTLTLEQAKLSEQTKVTNAATRAAAKESLGLNDAYAKLALRFAAAAKEAKSVAAQYGINSKQAQAAAKAANALNNQLKAIDASIGNHQRNVGNYGSALDGVGGKLKNLATGFLSLIGVVGIGSFFKDSIDEFIEMDKNVRLLQNTLKNIGVPEAFGRMETAANKLAKQFTYLDNDDIIKTFNQLVVYGKLTEDQMNDLIPVIIDFAAASGQDLASATSTVIKALEGNGRALKEYGIDMKDAKTVTEGFDLVMRELKPRVEGVGKAFGDSSAGGIASAKQELKNLKEEIGTGLTPVFVALLGVFSKVVTGLGYLKDKATEFISDIGDLFSGDFLVLIGEGNGKLEREAARTALITKKIIEKRLEEIKDFSISDLAEQRNGTQLLIINMEKQLTSLQGLTDKKSKERSKSLKASLEIERGIVEGIFKLQDTDKAKVLGIGDPDKGKKDNKDSDKAEKDRLARIEANAKAKFEIFKLEQERRAEFSKKIVDDEKADYLDRLLALNDYTRAKELIIQKTAEFELRTAKGKEIELVEAKRIDSLIRLSSYLSEAIKRTVKDFKDAERPLVRAVGSLQAEIDKIQQAAAKKLAEQLKNQKEGIRAGIKALLEELKGLVFDLFTGDIDRQKNVIQDRIDLLDKQKQKDIEVANQTITNAQDKAAAIAIIEARANAQKEQLEARQRELSQRRAKFERAEAIVNIISSTAQAVVKALASGPPPGNLIFAAIVGAIGAVQLARTLAQPIPKFAKGGTHKGGIMEVGEGGRAEGIVLPDGSVLKSPSRSTFMDAPAGTKIYPDFDKMMINATITKVPEFTVKTITDGTKDAINKIGKDIVRAIKSQPQTTFKGEPRWKVMTRSGSTFRNYLDRNL